jgi:hypothetical protein
MTGPNPFAMTTHPNGRSFHCLHTFFFRLSLLAVGLSLFNTAGAATKPDSHHDILHHHVPGLFLGVTSGDGEDTFTVGLEYEYMLNQHFGIGAVYERSPDRHHGDGTAIGLLTLNWHPQGAWRILAGAGRERVFDSKAHEYSVYRVGASYDFHLGKFGIAPSVALDFVNNKTNIVYGFALVRPF